MPTTSSHDIAIRLDGKFALSVCDKSLKPDIQGVARLFDLVEKKQITEFTVRHECPGLGLRIALSGEGRSCFVGCYDVYGIGCYLLPDGKEVWRRKDLKSVQSVLSFDFQKLVFCGRETGAAHLLDAKSGDTVEKLNGVEHCFGGLSNEIVIINRRSLELHRPFGKKLWSEKRAGKFVGWVYFTRTQFIVLEHELIRCFDIESQELVWSQQTTAKAIFPARFIFNEEADCFQLFQIRDDAPCVISLDCRSGLVSSESKLPAGVSGGFCFGGKALFNGHLCLFSAETGALLHDFTTDKILAQDPKYKNQLIQSLAKNSMSPAELEKYMKSEGFTEQEIKKAVFVKMYNDEMAKRRNKS
jgi:hypothetical protein